MLTIFKLRFTILRPGGSLTDGELEDSYTKAFHLFAPSVKQEKVELDLGQSSSGHFSHVSQPGTSYTLGHTVVDASRIHQDPHAWQVKQESYDAALEHDQTMPPHANEYAYVSITENLE